MQSTGGAQLPGVIERACVFGGVARAIRAGCVMPRALLAWARPGYHTRQSWVCGCMLVREYARNCKAAATQI